MRQYRSSSSTEVDGAALWANLHLLFWMSLIPYVTAWAGEQPLAPVPVALYGGVLLLCSISFMLLSWRLEAGAGVHPMSWGSRKNHLSIVLYASAILLSLWYAPCAAAEKLVLRYQYVVRGRIQHSSAGEPAWKNF